MNHAVGCTIGCLLPALLIGAPGARADSVFIIGNPPVDFEVIDMAPFEGIGDTGPFSLYSNVVLGSIGEARAMAEFDISPFSVPPGEFISSATFDVRITWLMVGGLGVPPGDTPDIMGLFGYVGNGLEEIPDFEAGDANFLGSIDTPNPFVGQVLSFDVTSFVTDLVDSQESFVGLTIAALEFGGIAINEGAGFPRLTIETMVPEPGTLVLLSLGGLGILRRRVRKGVRLAL